MRPVTLSVSDVMNNKALLGPFFAGESWAVWRSVIKAMSAERMSAAEVETFRSVAERDPPPQSVSEAVFIAGRGAGKDSVATLIATNIAITFDPKRSKLRPGEVACCMLLAVDRAQSAIAFNYIKGYFAEVPA